MSAATRLSVAALLLFALAGCETPEQRLQRHAREAMNDIDAAVAEIEASLPPEERERIEAHARRNLNGIASRCGTSLHFSDTPNFTDAVVTIDRAASAEQIACVRKEIPFARPVAAATPESAN